MRGGVSIRHCELPLHVKSCQNDQPSAELEMSRLLSSMKLLRCDVCTHYFSSFKKVELHLVLRLNLKLNKLPNFKAISNDDLPISVAAIEKEIKIEEVIFD
jgi:hypothetical protein